MSLNFISACSWLLHDSKSGRSYRDYIRINDIGVMEKNMETTIGGLGQSLGVIITQ